MEIGNNDGTVNTQTRDSMEKMVFCTDPARSRNRDLNEDTMKAILRRWSISLLYQSIVFTNATKATNVIAYYISSLFSLRSN